MAEGTSISDLKSSFSGRRFLILLGFLILGFFLSTCRVGDFEKHADYSHVRVVLYKPWSEVLPDIFDIEGPLGGIYPPLHLLLTKLFTDVFGRTVMAVRFFSIIAYLALIVLTWICINRFNFWQGWTRWWTLGAVVLSPPLIWRAQTEKYYMWVTLLSCATLVSALRLIEKRDRLSIFLYSLTGASTFYTHYASVFFLMSSFLGMLFLSVTRKCFRIREVIFFHLMIALICVPIVPTFLTATRFTREQLHKNIASDYPSSSKVVKEIVTGWGFGHGINPVHGLKAWLRNELRGTHVGEEGTGKEMRRKWIYFFAFTLAVLVIMAVIGMCLFTIFRKLESSKYLLYLVWVPIGAAVLSVLARLPLKLIYFTFGAWVFIMITGFVLSIHRRSLLSGVLAVMFIGLSLFSLRQYYSKIELRDPGFEVVEKYMGRVDPDAKVYLDSWITRNRVSTVPRDGNYYIIDFSKPVQPLSHEMGPFYIILAGTFNDVRIQMEEVAKQFVLENTRYQHVHSWVSLKSEGRSLHLFKIWRE